MSSFTLSNQDFINKLNETYPKTDERVSLTDVIAVYAHTLMTKSDMLTEEAMDHIICKQLKSFCDFDAETRENAKVLSAVKTTTESVIASIDNEDSQGLKKAYDELKHYQKRIEELEEAAFHDELTGAFNRRYLFTEKLDSQGNFISDGVLYVLNIDEFKAINKRYGHTVGDSVLKFFVRAVYEVISKRNHTLIRLGGAEFVFLVTSSQAQIIDRKLKNLKSTLVSKKFKTANDDTLKFGFVYAKLSYTSNESFKDVFSSSVQIMQ